MKPIDTAKLPMDPIPGSPRVGQEGEAAHFNAAIALVACFYETRAFAEWRDLESWAFAVRFGPTLGGNHPTRLRIAVDETCKKVDEIIAAEKHITDSGKRLDKELPKRIADTEGDIEKIEAAITELQIEADAKRAELTATQAEVKHLGDARKLMADVEGESPISQRRAVWKVIKAGKHGLE